MGGVAPFVATFEHFIAHAQGVAYAEDVDSPSGELFAYPVDGGVAGCAHHYLGFALEGFDDGFDKGGGFACARGAVDDGHFLGFDYLLHGVLLVGVEPGEGESGKVAEGGLEGADEGVAEVDEFGVVAAHGRREGVEHDIVAGVVDGHEETEEVVLAVGEE